MFFRGIPSQMAFVFPLLNYGAEWLVKGASNFARSLGVTPIVIGLTVVAFGTSAPELVVSLVSSIKGRSMIAVGNVVGSNIYNIALVLGVATTFQTTTSHRSVASETYPSCLPYPYIFYCSLWIRNLEGLKGLPCSVESSSTHFSTIISP